MPINWFVDTVNGNDTTGDGTSDGTAWKTIQKALNTITTSGSQGNVINCKDNGKTTLAASLSFSSTYTPTAELTLTIRGYTSVPNDGGVHEIDGNSAVANLINGSGAKTHVYFGDLYIHHFTAIALNASTNIHGYFRVHVSDCAVGVQNITTGNSLFFGYFHDFSSTTIQAVQCSGAGAVVFGLLLSTGNVLGSTLGLCGMGSDATLTRSIIHADGQASGVNLFIANGARQEVFHTTFAYTGSGTNMYGVNQSATSSDFTFAHRNLFVDLSTSGSIGFRGHQSDANASIAQLGPSQFFNCDTNRSLFPPSVIANDGTSGDSAVDPAFTNKAGRDFSVAIASKNLVSFTFPQTTTTTYAENGAAQRQQPAGGGLKKNRDQSLHPVEAGIAL